MPCIPLIEDLTTGSIPAGSNILVVFDPASQWYNAAVSIAAGWLRTGGAVVYYDSSKPPEDIRSQLKRLEVDVAELERNDKLRIWDTYSVATGQKSKEAYSYDSLKVTDLSIRWAKQLKDASERPDLLRMGVNTSELSRFNDERSWVDLSLTRVFVRSRLMKSTHIAGLIRGYHSDWAHKTLESAVDGVVDFKLDESMDPPRNLIRIRNMRNVGFDGRWQRLKVSENFAVTLEK